MVIMLISRDQSFNHNLRLILMKFLTESKKYKDEAYKFLFHKLQMKTKKTPEV